MEEWITISALATAAATFALALATFLSVRSANRSVRLNERILNASSIPILMPSRFEDSPQKIRYVDDVWIVMKGGRGHAHAANGVIYLAMSLRNAGQGLAVMDSWSFHSYEIKSSEPRPAETFRKLVRDLYIAGGDVGFWQGTFRDSRDAQYKEACNIISERKPFMIDIRYANQECGQITISRFIMTPVGEDGWLPSVGRHWRFNAASSQF
jgi:hypothetical protein